MKGQVESAKPVQEYGQFELAAQAAEKANADMVTPISANKQTSVPASPPDSALNSAMALAMAISTPKTNGHGKTETAGLNVELPSSTFTSTGTAEKLEMMPPAELTKELTDQVAIYLAKYYPEQQHGLMTLFLAAPPQRQYNLVFCNNGFIEFVDKSGVKTEAQRERDANKLALTNNQKMMWGKGAHRSTQ